MLARRLGLVAILCTSSFLAFSPASVRAQDEWVPGKFMIQAIGEMLDAADLLNRKMSYGYAEGVSMAGVLLQPKTEYALTRRFEQGVAYAIVAGGDEDVKDLDVEILAENGTVVMSDEREDRMGVIEWSPAETGDYDIRIKLFDAQRESFCAFAVLRKDGYRVKKQVAIDAAGKFFSDCNQIVMAAAKNEATVGFIAAEGQAGLFGMVLPQGESMTISGIVPGAGTAVMLGRGHDDSIDIDMHVSRGGAEIGSDIEDDSYPRYVGEFQDGVSHEMKLSNVSDADGNAFVIGGVLKVHPK